MKAMRGYPTIRTFLLLGMILLLQLKQYEVEAGVAPLLKKSFGTIFKSNRVARKLRTQPKLKDSLGSASDLQKKVLLLRGGLTIPFTDIHPKLSLTASKVLLQALLTLFNILCWAVPLKTKEFSTNENALSIANSFAGGIFLMLSVGHLLPEAIETIAHSSDSDSSSIGHGHAGGASNVLAFSLIGFMAMLFVEKVAFNVQHDHSHSHGDHHRDTSSSSSNNNSNSSSNVSSGGGVNSAVLLCLAMSIHSFCEAAALGLATDFTSAYMMAACIALHQPAESIALLVSFLKSNMSHRSITMWLSGFSLVALVGVAVGILVNGLASPTTEAIIMAITAGTFIYVGATEIANEEFEEGSYQQKMVRFLAYALGMAAMALIAKYSEQWGH